MWSKFFLKALIIFQFFLVPMVCLKLLRGEQRLGYYSNDLLHCKLEAIAAEKLAKLALHLLPFLLRISI